VSPIPHDPQWTIRDAVEADHAAIKLMNDGIQQAELDIVGYPMLTPDRLPPAYLAELLARDPQRQSELLVCEIEGRVVAFLSGRRAQEDDWLVEAEFNSFALVSDLFVDAEFRSRGVAQALLAEFSARMRAKGFKWLRIYAKAKNRKAIDAYLRFGFEPYEAVFLKPL
jgi:ribosomal protein S18 acetylase RimI-like enzyme